MLHIYAAFFLIRPKFRPISTICCQPIFIIRLSSLFYGNYYVYQLKIMQFNIKSCRKKFLSIDILIYTRYYT